MIRYKLQKKFLLKLLSVFFLFISFSAICYEPYKQTKKNNQDEKLELGRVTGSLPDGLSLEFGSDIITKNQLEGRIQRVDRKNRQIVINDDVFICDNKVKFSSNNQKKIRFRNLKKDMLVQLNFEISPEGLLAKRIHIQTKMKNNDKQNTKSNKREKADRSKSSYGSY